MLFKHTVTHIENNKSFNLNFLQFAPPVTYKNVGIVATDDVVLGLGRLRLRPIQH